jgi:drug/metabolite transporter (DMT)-like permease
MFSKWQFWTILYLISAVLFSQCFKKANRSMKDATCLTLLLEGFTALFSLLLIFMFPVQFSTSIWTYIVLGIVCVIYAVTDRLNIEARYGLEPSTFSMLKQLSTVFIIIFGIIFMKQELVIHRLFGALIIVVANLLLAFNKGKFRFNKYFIMCIISNILFAIAMLINMNISSEFNVAIYTFFTVGIPFYFIALFNKVKIKELKKEFNRYDKKLFMFSALMWCLMLISSVKAYELGNVVIVASFLALTSILNSIVELLFNRDRKTFFKKLIIGILIVIGVILVKM